MASERIGKVYEAVVKRCLSTLILQRRLTGTVKWNEIIAGHSVEPDLWLAGPAGNPTVVLLVTHSGASSASEKKFWRDIGEIAEFKIARPDPPIVGGILFENSIKHTLSLLEREILDFFSEVPTIDVHRSTIITTAVRQIAATKKKTKEFPIVLETLILDNPELQEAVDWLSDVLLETICSAEENQFWTVAKGRVDKRKDVVLRTANETAVRRGIAKLLIPPDPTVLVAGVRKHQEVPLPDYLWGYGIVTEQTAGWRTSDPDVVGVVKLLGEERVFQLVERYSSDARIRAVVKPLREAGTAMNTRYRFIDMNWAELCETSGLFHRLLETHADIEQKVFALATINARPGWLFLSLLSIVKAAGKTRQSFGYAGIVRAIGDLSEENKLQIAAQAVADHVGGDLSLRAPRTVEYGLRDWFYGSSRTNFSLRPFELYVCSLVMASRLSMLEQSKLVETFERAKQYESRDLVENVLVPFNTFQPLKTLLEHELTRRGVKYCRHQYYSSALREAVQTKTGTQINIRSGATEVVIAGKTLIRWISATNKGRDHKRKEFAGKGATLPIVWSAPRLRYVANDNIERLLLLVDGTFRDSDLELLIRLGWDRVFYPDEIELLISAIL